MLRRLWQAWRSDSWVRPCVKKYWKAFAAALVLSVVAYVFASALMFTSGYMISLAATIPATVLALHVPSIFVRIFGIGKPVAAYFEKLFSHDWVLRMTSSLRERLYRVYSRLFGTASARDKTTGEMLGLFSGDIEHVQDLYLRSVLPLASMLLLYAIVVGVFGMLSWAAAAMFFIAIGLVSIVMPFWSLCINGPLIERRQQLEARLYSAMTEDVIGIVDWRLSGRRDDFLSRAERREDELWELNSRIERFERRLSFAKQCIFALLACGTFLWAGWVFACGAPIDGLVSTEASATLGSIGALDAEPCAANWIGAFVLCIFPLLEVFMPAGDAALGLAKHERALGDLNGLDSRLQAANQEGDTRGSAGEDVAVSIQGVSFAYPEAQSAIFEQMSLDVRKGEHIAIIGRSGSGKSTLLKLIQGLAAPDRGKVMVQGRIGIVEQSPYIFHQSLADNLRIACQDASDSDLTRALNRVGLGELFARLPQGLDTMMAEDGLTISGGERHRLALARILLADCDIVLLDEPYIGLDSKTEAAVSSVLLDTFKTKTLIVVTHHLQDIENYDKVIMVGDDGSITAGTPQALQETNAVFRELMIFERG